MSNQEDYFDKLNDFRGRIKKIDSKDKPRFLPKDRIKSKKRDLELLNKRDVHRFFKEKFERHIKPSELKTLETFFVRLCEAWHEEDLVEEKTNYERSLEATE